jgi:sulfate adenylyltransferase (ADP) / ATP adenylyltransferase
VADIPPSGPGGHYLVLNKFPVIANHFILATRPFAPQTDLLEPADLGATLSCLRSWSASAANGGSRKGRLFAFFNSGPESGASQAHRHVQFVPVEDMQDGCTGWVPVIDLFSSASTTTVEGEGDGGFGIECLRTLPFKHFAISLEGLAAAREKGREEAVLHVMYMALYRAALRAAGISDPSELGREAGPAAISYNLAMTEDVMLLCPRRAESASIPLSEKEEGEGMVALNGTILAGTLMVKSEGQWDRIRGDAGLIDSLLEDVGVPNAW